MGQLGLACNPAAAARRPGRCRACRRKLPRQSLSRPAAAPHLWSQTRAALPPHGLPASDPHLVTPRAGFYACQSHCCVKATTLRVLSNQQPRCLLLQTSAPPAASLQAWLGCREPGQPASHLAVAELVPSSVCLQEGLVCGAPSRAPRWRQNNTVVNTINIFSSDTLLKQAARAVKGYYHNYMQTMSGT